MSIREESIKINNKSKYFDATFPRPVPLSSEIRGGVNANKKHYERLRRLGIGEIHAHDEESINHLCYIVAYLSKVEQFIKPVADPKTKLLRRGKMPMLTFPKRGRPRNIEQKAMPTNDIEKTRPIPNGYIPHRWSPSISQKNTI